MANDDDRTALIDDRALIIRQLAQGGGLTREAVKALANDQLDLLIKGQPRHDWTEDQVYDLLRFTVCVLPANDGVLALRSALGLSVSGVPEDSMQSVNLTQRRQAYLDEPTNTLTLRTLIRHEQDGAEQVADYLETAGRLRPSKLWAKVRKFEVSWIDEAEVDRHRIERLEILTTVLGRLVFEELLPDASRSKDLKIEPDELSQSIAMLRELATQAVQNTEFNQTWELGDRYLDPASILPSGWSDEA